MYLNSDVSAIQFPKKRKIPSKASNFILLQSKFSEVVRLMYHHKKLILLMCQILALYSKAYVSSVYSPIDK